MRTPIGQKSMFYQNIEKAYFIVLSTLPLNHKANEEAQALY